MDRVTAASSVCQPSLHAPHTFAAAAAVRSRAAQQLNTLKESKIQMKTVQSVHHWLIVLCQVWLLCCVLLCSMNTKVNLTQLYFFLVLFTAHRYISS